MWKDIINMWIECVAIMKMQQNLIKLKRLVKTKLWKLIRSIYKIFIKSLILVLVVRFIFTKDIVYILH